ncbi:hypothetical protein [Aneurinibacillus tyrosinisolvens]|uniref:hypothetical protein n=1 Tax=Aneurinibacillus tyrosinisolvens TaxID=1443435 RepID=UPI00069BE9C8|nr:hypothetical protein [Aneurinibacillus tyrosinisolvens]
MKTSHICILLLAVGTLISVTACNGLNETQQQIQTKQDQTRVREEAKPVSASQSPAINAGVKGVIQLIGELERQLQNNPKPSVVNEIGKKMAEKWDLVEKEVEKRYPDDYKKIEESLYPLIAEAGKQQLDVSKIKALNIEARQKLEKFLDKAQ